MRGGGIGQSYVYRRVYRQFHACITWVCEYDYPYVAIIARGDGTSQVGGGL